MFVRMPTPDYWSEEEGEIMDGIIIESWSGISILLIPIPNIFLTWVLFIHLRNTVYKHVKRSRNQNEK